MAASSEDYRRLEDGDTAYVENSSSLNASGRWSPVPVIKRSMSKIVGEPGSVQGSAYTVFTAMVGAGALTIGSTMRELGVLQGLFMVIFMSAVANFSLRLLILSTTRGGERSYRKLAERALGPNFAHLIQLCLVLNMFGTIVAYMLVIRTIVPLALDVIYDADDNDPDKPDQIKKSVGVYILLFFTVVVMLPLSLLKSMKPLRFSSMLSVACFLYISVVTVAKYFDYCMDSDDQIKHCFWESLDGISLWKWDIKGFLYSVPLYVATYACHVGALPVYENLRKPSPVRMHKVINRGVGMAAVVYAIIGIFSYLTFTDTIQSNFLLNNYRHDIEVTIGALALCVAVLLSCPIFAHGIRINVLLYIHRHEQEATSGSSGDSSTASNPRAPLVKPVSHTQPLPRRDIQVDSARSGRTQQVLKDYGAVSRGADAGPAPAGSGSLGGDDLDHLGDAIDEAEEDSFESRMTSEQKRKVWIEIVTISVITISCAFAIAIMVDDLGDVLLVIGASTAVFIAFIAPPMFLHVLSPNEHPKTRRGGYFQAITLSTLSCLSLAMMFGCWWIDSDICPDSAS